MKINRASGLDPLVKGTEGTGAVPLSLHGLEIWVWWFSTKFLLKIVDTKAPLRLQIGARDLSLFALRGCLFTQE